VLIIGYKGTFITVVITKTYKTEGIGGVNSPYGTLKVLISESHNLTMLIGIRMNVNISEL